jgi:hypothetical protein
MRAKLKVYFLGFMAQMQSDFRVIFCSKFQIAKQKKKKVKKDEFWIFWLVEKGRRLVPCYVLGNGVKMHLKGAILQRSKGKVGLSKQDPTSPRSSKGNYYKNWKGGAFKNHHLQNY